MHNAMTKVQGIIIGISNQETQHLYSQVPDPPKPCQRVLKAKKKMLILADLVDTDLSP